MGASESLDERSSVTEIMKALRGTEETKEDLWNWNGPVYCNVALTSILQEGDTLWGKEETGAVEINPWLPREPDR